MKAKVIDSLCIGCGACTIIAPEEFDFNDEGVSTALNETVKEENRDKVMEAKESCPTQAIEVLDNENKDNEEN